MRLVAFGALLLLAGCGLSPSMQAAIQAVQDMQASGQITAEQAAALVAGFEEASGWSTVQIVLGNIITAAATYFGVMVRRGPPERGARVAAKRSK